MWIKNLWKFLRTIRGDDAYEVYLNNFSKCTNHLNSNPLSRKDFYSQKLQQKWNKINRCC